MNTLRMRILVAGVVILLLIGLFALYEASRVPVQPTTIPATSVATTTVATASSTASSTAASAALAPAAPSLQFEVVTSAAAQEQGLGGRASIPDDYAMLFVFPKDDRYGFWMKDMLVPIDMIWLSDNGTVILVDDSVAPDTYPHVFYPPSPVKYVLETKAGFAKEHGWTLGTHVMLPAPYSS